MVCLSVDLRDSDKDWTDLLSMSGIRVELSRTSGSWFGGPLETTSWTVSLLKR